MRARSTKTSHPRGYRILLADTHVPTRDALAELLVGRGHSVMTAGTAKRARTMLEQLRFDVAIVTERLPDGDGRALLEELKTQRRFQAIGALVVMDRPARTERDVELLSKPLELDDFIERVETAARRGQLLKIVRDALESPLQRPVFGL